MAVKMVENRGKIKETLLSHPPQENALLVAIASVLAILVVSLLSWRDQELYSVLAADSTAVLAGAEYWRLGTAIAVHADMKHFMSNALLFGFFCYLLYGYFGFFVYPVAVGVLGAAANLISLMSYPAGVRLVGASGVVYLMAGFWLTMYMLIERRFSWKRRLLHGIGVGLVLLMPTALNPSVSYRTHLIGLGLGFLLAIAYFFIKRHSIRDAEVREEENEIFFDNSWQESPPVS